MKKKSFVVRIVCIIIITLILLTVLFITYTSHILSTMRQSELDSADFSLRIYGQQIDSRLAALDIYLEEMLSSHALIGQMSDEDQAHRYYAAMELKNQMQSYLANSGQMDYMVITAGPYENQIAVSSNRMSFWDKESADDYVRSQIGTSQDGRPGWQLKKINGQRYLVKEYATNEWALGLMTRTDVFFSGMYGEEFPKGKSFLVTDGEGTCFVNLKKGDDQYLDTVVHNKEDVTAKPAGGYYLLSADSGQGDIRITAMIDRQSITGNVSRGNIFILLTLVVLSGCSVMILLYLRREIYQPVNRLITTMANIEAGDYQQRVETAYSSKELSALTAAFDHMMDVIINQRIRAYDEKNRLLDAEVKYFRLQIRPHFFLNALTTIYSMSYQNKNDSIRDYIDALTKTIRYMFQTGLHTVPLREEISHLKNYFEMQNIKYPNCVFLYFDIEEEGKEWQIPQMLLHTFMENEYKYAVNVERMLTVLIKAEIVWREGERMLYIRMEDDGVGFPEDVIRYINYQSENPEKDGTRVGLWNIKRTMEVIYQKEHLLQLSNLETSGCLIEIYIPEHARLREKGEVRV